jgi:hypothetical protein
MLQVLSTVWIPVVMGVMVGCAYTNGVVLLQSLKRTCNYMLPALALTTLTCFCLQWLQLGMALGVAFGIVLVVWFKMMWLRPRLPSQLKGCLSAKPGHSVPDLCPNEHGGWTLVYPDGMCMVYDRNGKLAAMDFYNGWNRSLWRLDDCSRSDSIGAVFASDRRVM